MTDSAPQEDRSFFVYAYIRDADDSVGFIGTPYYIGKGKGDRHKVAHVQKVGPDGTGMRDITPENEDQIVTLASDLTEEEAFEVEKRLIAFYGKACDETGCLLNFVDGGQGSSGYVYPEYLKEIRRNQLKGNNYGSRVDWTPEKRARLSAACLGRVYVKTAARKEQDENLKILYRWRHEKTGEEIESSCIDMARRHAKTTGKDPMKHQAGFWRVANGKAARTHGWTCLNPEKEFVGETPEEKAAKQRKGAANRVAKRAEEMFLTVEQYNAMDYSTRSKRYRQMEAAGQLKSQQEKPEQEPE